MSQHPAPTATPCSRNIALEKTGADKFKADNPFTGPDGLPCGAGMHDDITARTAGRPQIFDGAGTPPAREGRLPFSKK